jgi:hypothetical protein
VEDGQNDASKNSSIVSCVFFAAGTCLPSRCLGTIQGGIHRQTGSKVISYAYFIAYFLYSKKWSRLMTSRCCLSVCVYPPIVARQRLGKNPPIVSRQRLARNVTAVTNTHATIEELSDASFSIWPVSYQGN